MLIATTTNRGPHRQRRWNQRLHRSSCTPAGKSRRHGVTTRPVPTWRGPGLPALIGHDVPSQIVKAGRRLDLHPLPPDFDVLRERALGRSA